MLAVPPVEVAVVGEELVGHARVLGQIRQVGGVLLHEAPAVGEDQVVPATAGLEEMLAYGPARRGHPGVVALVHPHRRAAVVAADLELDGGSVIVALLQ